MSVGEVVARPRYLVVVLAAFTALVVLTTDVYLPVLPRVASDLSTTHALAAATLSTLLLGVAVGQIVAGPLSDAVGRRVPILLGGLGYAVVHVLCALAPSIAVLLILRFFAGVATAACIAVARAVVADAYPLDSATRAFATLSAVTAIVPVVAPVTGGLLALIMSWRGMFLVLAGVALVLTAVGWRVLPETLPVERRTPPRLGAVVHDLLSVVRARSFMAYVAVLSAFGGLVLFGYIGASTFVLQGRFGLSPQQYSAVFAANSIGIFVASNTTRHLVARVGPARLLAVGQAVSVVGVAVIAVGVAIGTLILVLAGLFFTISCVGLVMPPATALGMAESGGRAGSASGVFGICQFAAGAVAAPLAGAGGSPWSFVALLAVGVVTGPILLRVLRPRPALVAAR